MPWHLWQTCSRVQYYDVVLAVPAGCLGANQLCHLSGFASVCSHNTSGSKQQQLFCSASAHHPYSFDLCWWCQLSRPCTNLSNPCQSVAAAGAAHTCLDPGFQPCVGVVIMAELHTALLLYSAATASSLMYGRMRTQSNMQWDWLILSLVILVQGCYAAILHPSQLPSGKGVSAAVNSVLCQFSGLETEADDMLVRTSITIASTYANNLKTLM